MRRYNVSSRVNSVKNDDALGPGIRSGDVVLGHVGNASELR